MKIVYSLPNCPGCYKLKHVLDVERIPYVEKVIGKDITKEDFFKKYPDVRSVPFEVEES